MQHEELVQFLRDQTEDQMRVIFVAEWLEDGLRYTVPYIRDDVEECYSPREYEEIAREIVFEGLNRSYHEGLYHVGQLRCGFRLFDDALVFRFPTGSKEGVIVSLDPDSDLDVLSIVAGCQSRLSRVE